MKKNTKKFLFLEKISAMIGFFYHYENGSQNLSCQAQDRDGGFSLAEKPYFIITFLLN